MYDALHAEMLRRASFFPACRSACSSGAIVRTTEQLGSHLVDLGRGCCSTPRTSVLLMARPDYQAGDGGRPNLSKGQMIGFVFAFVADVRNDPRWHTDVLEAQLTDLLDDIKDTFGMTGVALLESRATGEEPVASVGTVTQSRPVLSAPAGDSLRLVAWGPEVFGQDAAALRRMAGVTARTLEAQRLAAEAARVDDLARIDGPAPPCSLPSATTCAHR
jgi:hypothetical protein